MKRKLKKKLSLTSFMLWIAVGVLSFVPHHTCACGQYEDGSQLTHFVLTASAGVVRHESQTDEGNRKH